MKLKLSPKGLSKVLNQLLKRLEYQKKALTLAKNGTIHLGKFKVINADTTDYDEISLNKEGAGLEYISKKYSEMIVEDIEKSIEQTTKWLKLFTQVNITTSNYDVDALEIKSLRQGIRFLESDDCNSTPLFNKFLRLLCEANIGRSYDLEKRHISKNKKEYFDKYCRDLFEEVKE